MTDILHNNSFEELAFDGIIEKEVLKIWLDVNLNIEPIFKNRSDLDKKSFIFDGKELLISNDIKKSEIPSLIFRINQLTFGEYLPDDSSANELKFKIVRILDNLLENSTENKNDISKYVRLYSQLAGEKEAQRLSDSEYRIEILNSDFIDEIERQDFIKKLNLKNNSKEKLEYLLEEIMENLDEAIFEKGIKDLGRINTSTQSEIKTLIDKYGLQNNRINLEKYKDFGGIKGLLSNNFDYFNNFFNELYSDKKDKGKTSNSELFNNLGINEKKLREEMNIDYWKKILRKSRQNGNSEDIEKKEISAVNLIIRNLYKNYPWNMLNLDGGFPGKIKTNKEIYCVGFSLLGHRFLKELGIKHKGLEIPEHSALEINIGDKQYYFDPTGFDRIIKSKYGEFQEVNFTKKYRKLYLDGDETTLVIQNGDTEDILQQQIYNNLGAKYDHITKKTDKDLITALAFFDKKINILPNRSTEIIITYICKEILKRGITIDKKYNKYINKAKEQIKLMNEFFNKK